MEIITEIQNQLMLIVPIGLAILSCILVYMYSIGPTQQPKFKLSAGDDRKTAQKKKKLKEKKPAANGNVATGIAKPEKSPVKETKKVPEPVKKEKKLDGGVVKNTKKPEGIKKASEAQEIKKKTNKKVSAEKPADFDDGKWETVPSKADKKKKVEQPQSKKEKKVKHQLESQVKAEESANEEVPPVVIEEIEPDVQVEPELSSDPKLLVEEVPAHVEEVAPIVEQKKDKKKKKARADKVEKVADAVVTTPSVNEPEIIQPKRTQVSASPDVKAAPSGTVSDELGGTWTDAKPVKKSKKKARRDN